jgi:hypothetical protein
MNNSPAVLTGQAISVAVLISSVALLAYRGTQIRQENEQGTRWETGSPRPATWG